MIHFSLVQFLPLRILVKLPDLFHQRRWVFYIIKLYRSRAWSRSQFFYVHFWCLLLKCRSRNPAWICHQKFTDLLDVTLWQSLSHTVFLWRLQWVPSVVEWDCFPHPWIVVHVKYVIVIALLKICIPLVVLFASWSASPLVWILCNHIADLHPLACLPHVRFRVQAVSKHANLSLLFTVIVFYL